MTLTALFVSTFLAASVFAEPSYFFSSTQGFADNLVQQLRDLPTPLPGVAPSNGITPPIQLRRQDLYSELRQLGRDALPAARGLSDPDVPIRRKQSRFRCEEPMDRMIIHAHCKARTEGKK